MRTIIAAIIGVVAAALIICAYIAKRSDRDIAPKVTRFLISLLPPVIGNLIIIVAHTEGFALFGRYLYAIGIDVTMCCLLGFTLHYCGLKWNKTWRSILTACVALDIAQLLCNPFFSHAFAPDMMIAYGAPYYNVHSYIGRNLHLVLVYAIMAAVLGLLFMKMIRGGKIYSEKYSIIFFLLLFTGAWEVFYIFFPNARKAIRYRIRYIWNTRVLFFSILQTYASSGSSAGRCGIRPDERSVFL